MPFHKLKTISDAHAVVARYASAANLREKGPGTSSGFAHWLYKFAKSAEYVSAVEINKQLDAYIEAWQVEDSDLDFVLIEECEHAHALYLFNQRMGNDLLWIVRETKSTEVGRACWDDIVMLATVPQPVERVDSVTMLADIIHVLEKIAWLRLPRSSENYPAYRPGIDERLDQFARVDIWRIDETLADESLWTDDRFTWPFEVDVLAQLASNNELLVALRERRDAESRARAARATALLEAEENRATA